jgi:DedD protein
MPDQPVREIQLGGKQLVFLFMAAVVLAVAVFLLGISVGRGVRGATETATTTSTDVPVATDAAPVAAPAKMPPPTVTTAADLQYHDRLQGSTPPAVAPPVSGPVAESGATPKAGEESQPADDQPAAGATKKGETAAPKASEKPVAAKVPDKTVDNGAAAKNAVAPAAKAAPASGGSWFVQVDVFKSKENADRQAASLKSKGFPATISSAAGLFHVRVGPYVQRDEAERIRQKLQREEGLKPSIQR